PGPRSNSVIDGRHYAYSGREDQTTVIHNSKDADLRNFYATTLYEVTQLRIPFNGTYAKSSRPSMQNHALFFPSASRRGPKKASLALEWRSHISQTIQVGDSIPQAEFPTVLWSQELDSGAACGVPTKLNTNDWAGKKVVLVAVPGAFTPTCHVNHIPAFVKDYKEFEKRGVDVVAVIAANDPFVMSGWGRVEGAKGNVLFLTDTYAEWSKKLGLSLDLTDKGLGIRTSRYALLLDNNKVQKVLVEPNPGALQTTSASSVLAAADELGWKK
ncbi:hypothetical protein FRC11_014487, partial [Ceratobasidium sp. 423]